MQNACVAAVRQQRQWKLEAALTEATNTGKLRHKSERERQARLQTSGNVEEATAAFKKHLQEIVQHGKPPKPEEEDKMNKLQKATGEPLDFNCEYLFDKITRTIAKMKKARVVGPTGS